MKHCNSHAATAANPVGTMKVCACPIHELTAMSVSGGIGAWSAARGSVEVAA